MMKGLELAEAYYDELGRKLIRDKFPEYTDRTAAGLVGEGSECFGFDDEISRDHDWGPGFCFWLNHADYHKIGAALQAEYEQLPAEFMGYTRLATAEGSGRVGVFEITAFYRRFIGRNHSPRNNREWAALPDNFLAVCTNGKIFFDPLQEFTKIRQELLAYYPEDVRLAKISAKAMSASKTGQYNFKRAVKRGARYTAQYTETKFCYDLMSIVFLLNRTYQPFYKWSLNAVQRLPLLGPFTHAKITEMAGMTDMMKKAGIMEELCVEIANIFREQGISRSTSSFLLDHGPFIRSNIIDEDLREGRLRLA